jgi:hypothetical protein
MNATFIGVSLKSFVTLFVSFPMYVKVAHFIFWCCGSAETCNAVTNFKNDLILNLGIAVWWTANKTVNSSSNIFI